MKIYIRNKDNTTFECDMTYQTTSFELIIRNDLIGEKKYYGSDLLDCFNQFRKTIEALDYIILVNGTRKNTWASGGLRDSSNGELTYLLTENTPYPVLNIFEFSDIDNVTFQEQLRFYKLWLDSKK